MEVVTRERFLSNEQEQHVLPEGLTIDEMLAAVNWNSELRPWTHVTVDGQHVPEHLWRSARPKEGRNLLVILRPSGGGGGGGSTGKQIGLAVAAIAIAVVAWYAAPAIVGAFTGLGATAAAAAYPVATALVTAGIAIAGNLALGALVQPGKLGPKLLGNSGSGGNAASESSTYGLKGATNTMNPYGVVPRVYGRHRITPPLAAEPYVVSSGTAQTLHLLFDFGQGPLLIEDLRIGNTPIGEFTTARWFIHPYYTAGQPLSIYLNDQATMEVNAVLVQLQDNIRAVPQAASTVVLEFQFPGGLVEYNQQGASFQRNEHVTVFYAPSSDPNNWQPISNVSPYAIFNGEGGTDTSGEAQVASFGTYIWNREPPGFTTSDPAALNIPTGAFFNFLGQNYTVQGIDNPAPHNPGQYLVKLDRNPDGVNYIYTHTGILPGHEGQQGTITTYAGGVILGPLTVTFGPSPYDVEFHGQTRSPRTVSVVLQMPYEDVWRIMVRRSTPVSNSSLVSNAITWGSMRAGRWSAPIYPKSIRTIMELAVTATEQVTGQIQAVNALATSILWDARVGQMVPSRNPGVIYQDILTGEANPRPVPWSQIDQTRCQQWANNCDAAAPQGDTKCTFDMVIDFRSTIGELCQTVCSAGRAAPTMRDGLYSVMEEEEVRNPVQMFTNRNASGFSATRSWVDFPHAIRAKYMSENTWNQEELFVYADGYSSANAFRFETMEFPGCVRPWQVWRAGRYFIAAAMLRREKLTLTTDVENLVCQRGDLVKIAQDRLFSNIVVRARNVDGQVITHDGLIDFPALTPPMTSADIMPYSPANAGSDTTLPPGWQASGFAASGLTHTVLGKGVLPDGRDYVDIQVKSQTLTSTLIGVYQFRTGQPVPVDNGMVFVNSDDKIMYEQYIDLISDIDNSANITVHLAGQRINADLSAGFGTVIDTDIDLSNNSISNHVFQMTLGSTLGVVVGINPRIQITPTVAGTSLDMVFRISGARVRVKNKNPDLLQRVNAQGGQLIANPQGVGADLGVVTGSGIGVMPDDWVFVGWAGWTKEIVATKRTWSYWDVDIRFQAPAGTGTCTMAFGSPVPLPADKGVVSSVQMRQLALATAAPTVRLINQAQTSGGAFVSNNTGGAITLDTSFETRVTLASSFAGFPTAAIARPMMNITPASGQPCDTTIRFRLPVFGDTDLIASLPTPVPPAGWYADIRAYNGDLWNSISIMEAPAADKLTFSADWAQHMRPGDLIAIGQLTTETGNWIVDKITPGPDLSAQIEFMEEALGIFAADGGAIPPYVPNNGNGILGELGGVSNLILSSTLYVYTTDKVPTHEISLTWDPPGYEVREYMIRRTYIVPDPGDSPLVPYSDENVRIDIGSTATPNFRDTIDTRTLRQIGTTIRYEVLPISASGRRGAVVSVSDVFYPDLTGPPKINFTTNVLSETTMLIWDAPDIPDLGGYQIRFLSQEDSPISGAAPEWERMVSVVDNVSPVLTSLTVHSQTGTYAIRAFDTSGNFGVVSWSVTKIGVLPNVNELTRLTEGPTFTGVFENTEVVSGELRLAKDTSGNYYPEGWFYPTSAVDYPASWVFRIRGSIKSYALPLTPDPKGNWNVQIWVSIQKFAPKLDSPWFDPLSTAIPLAGGPDTYIPLGTVANTDLEGRLINWAIRLVSRRADLTPSVEHALLIVDHSERREFGDDVSTGTGGINIDFQYPFFDPPTVAVTINNGQSGDRLVKSVSTTALTVEIFNAAGTSVDRSIDWQAIGYGRGVS
jgi:hypothetical protein